MPLPLVPVAVDPLATLLAALGRQAEVLRTVAARAGLLAGALDWHSASARGLEVQVAALNGALRAAADRLDTLPQLAAQPAAGRICFAAPGSGGP